MCKPPAEEKPRAGLSCLAGSVITSLSFAAGVLCVVPRDDLRSDAWRAPIATFLFCALVRAAAVGIFPRFKNSATRETVENFGVQLLSLCISSYISVLLLFGGSYGWEARGTVVTTPAAAAGTNVQLFQHMGTVLLVYILLDTVHLRRIWKVAPNRSMLLHHAIFSVVLAIGVCFVQLPQQFRMHAILFSAELSTPFLNARWILAKLPGRRPAALMNLLSAAFALVFLLTRVGGYGLLLKELFSRGSGLSAAELQMPPPVNSVFRWLILASYALNLYWAALILNALRTPRQAVVKVHRD